MRLSQLNEFGYNGFGGDDHLNPDGSKKPWKHKRAELSDEEIDREASISELEKELKKADSKLKAAKSKANKSKEPQKSAIIHTTIFPLQATVKRIREQIKELQ